MSELHGNWSNKLTLGIVSLWCGCSKTLHVNLFLTTVPADYEWCVRVKVHHKVALYCVRVNEGMWLVLWVVDKTGIYTVHSPNCHSYTWQLWLVDYGAASDSSDSTVSKHCGVITFLYWQTELHKHLHSIVILPSLLRLSPSPTQAHTLFLSLLTSSDNFVNRTRSHPQKWQKYI